MASMTIDDSLEKDEMDSLFEGMVLFNPSHIPSADVGVDVDVDVDVDTSISTSMDSQIQELDENLFSDLTLTTPEEDETPPSRDPPLPKSASISRQSSSSRRRKRGSGLRIGYGRDKDYAIRQVNEFQIEQEEEEEEEEEEAVTTAVAKQDQLPSQQGTDSVVSSQGDPSVSSRIDEEVNNEEDSKNDQVELKFEQIRVHISGKLKLARESVVSVSAMRKESIRKRRKAVDAVNEASSRFKELEKKLDEACEAEDFETAERVSEDLASAEKEKERLDILLRDAEAYCDAVDTKMHQVLQSLIQAEEECVPLLRTFSLEAASNADSVLRNAEAKSSKDIAEWHSSIEAILVSKFELEIQSQLVHEARSVLNESIEHSVEDDRREIGVLCKKKEVLTEELKKLLALVKEKEAEIEENDTLIQKVEKKIDGVVSCFKEVQTSIDNNYETLQSGLSQLMMKNEVLLKSKKDIDDYLSQEESHGAKIKDLSRISSDEANMYEEIFGLRKSLALFISKSKDFRVSLAKSEERISEEVQMLKQEALAARSSLQELSSVKSSIQQKVESCKQRLLFIDNKVPELEAEKKVAAATRNFKEAARLAAEAKALCIEKEEIHSKIDSAELELKKLEEEICLAVDGLQETEVRISSKENELAMARFQRLILIARAARAESSAALELGDHEEAEALVSEAEAADAEARKLAPIYNLKEEDFANLPKLFVSAELVSMLGAKQLAELAASANLVI